jgi:hypothetical protein
MQFINETPLGYTLLLSITAAGFAILYKVRDLCKL